MHQRTTLTLKEIQGDLKTYFNWSANALMPINPNAADHFLKENRMAILNVAQSLLKKTHYCPDIIYRGIILKHEVESISPNDCLQYLSFSEERAVAEYFADPKGFGNQVIDNESRLGKYGYVILYRPQWCEILFHHQFLSILPYAEAFSQLGMNGHTEVSGLRDQKEIMILQPTILFTNIIKKFDH